MSQGRGARGRNNYVDDGIQRPSTADSYHSRPRNEHHGSCFGQLGANHGFGGMDLNCGSGSGRNSEFHTGFRDERERGGQSDQRRFGFQEDGHFFENGYGYGRGGGNGREAGYGNRGFGFQGGGQGGERLTSFGNGNGYGRNTNHRGYGSRGDANLRQGSYGGSDHFHRSYNRGYDSGNSAAGSYQTNSRGNGSTHFHNRNQHNQDRHQQKHQQQQQQQQRRNQDQTGQTDFQRLTRLTKQPEKTKTHDTSEAAQNADPTAAKENVRFGAAEAGEASAADRSVSSDRRDFQLLLYRRAVLTRENDDEGYPHIVGNCPDMCPAEEREKRSRLRDLAVFERLDSNQSKTTKELAVKKFCRTFSGKYLKESDVRPLPVLCRTMLHLLRILDVDEYPFEVIHDFLFDRTRAIRQEMSMQRISNKLAVCVYENIVRFHIVSERELRRLRTSGKVFDSHLNHQQLSKALLSLLGLYLALGDDSRSLENEAEFYSYYVLLNLDQALQLTLWFQSISPALLRSPQLEFARDVLRCYRQDNYRRFFHLVAKASYLQACVMELHFNQVRASAIKMINSGAYKLHPFPLSDLGELLLMTGDDMEEFCTLHGVAVSGESQLLAKQNEFTSPKQPLRHYHCQIIEDRRPAKFQELCSDLTILFQ